MNPITVETAGATLVAEGSSKGWMRQRWTEIKVWYFPHGIQNGGKCWLVEVAALSVVPGERKKTNRMASASLERALSIVDESDMGLTVRETAKEYAEDNGIPYRAPGKQLVPEKDVEAAWWLFGTPSGIDFDGSMISSMLGMPADDFYIGIADSVRGQGPVMIPLRALLPFVDRRAFQEAMKRERARG